MSGSLLSIFPAPFFPVTGALSPLSVPGVPVQDHKAAVSKIFTLKYNMLCFQYVRFAAALLLAEPMAPGDASPSSSVALAGNKRVLDVSGEKRVVKIAVRRAEPRGIEARLTGHSEDAVWAGGNGLFLLPACLGSVRDRLWIETTCALRYS